MLYLHSFEIAHKECVQTINNYVSTIKMYSLFNMTIDIYEYKGIVRSWKMIKIIKFSLFILWLIILFPVFQ